MTSPAHTASRIITYVADVIIIVLGIRFILRLFDANAANAFVQFVYQVADIFLRPFRGIFETNVIEGSTVEWSTLFAMLIYGIGAHLIVYLVHTLTDETDTTHAREAHE